MRCAGLWISLRRGRRDGRRSTNGLNAEALNRNSLILARPHSPKTAKTRRKPYVFPTFGIADPQRGHCRGSPGVCVRSALPYSARASLVESPPFSRPSMTISTTTRRGGSDRFWRYTPRREGRSPFGGVRKVRWSRAQAAKRRSPSDLLRADAQGPDLAADPLLEGRGRQHPGPCAQGAETRKWSMKLSDKELRKRDATRDIGAEILQAVRDIKARRGNSMPSAFPRRRGATEVEPLAGRLRAPARCVTAYLAVGNQCHRS